MARAIAAEFDRDHADAAAWLKGGWEDMYTVRRLGVRATGRDPSPTTNCIESMIAVARTVRGGVKRWQDGTMVMRWVAPPGC